MITKFDDILAGINIQNVTFEDFKSKVSILDISDTSGTFAVRSDIKTFLDRVVNKTGDTRKDRLDLYLTNLYDMLVTNAEKSLRAWYEKYIELKMSMSDYINMADGGCLNDRVFNGAANAKFGRLAKNINFNDFYNTKKLYMNDSEYVYGLMKVMYENFHIRNSLAAPAFFDILIGDDDYTRVWNYFMMGANKASIFNPYTYRSILNDIFEGETLFAPVMGWNTYQQGFYTSKFKHFIATDVIPGVVNNGSWLHEQYKTSRSGTLMDAIGEEEKTVDLYLCPSEKLQERYGFVDKYRESVDAVLFSPPYFDLEIYPGEEQSVNSFGDYNAWLEGYWRETVKLCRQVMKPNAKFAFVIRNYRNHDKVDNSISQDMRDVVCEELTYLEKYDIKWNAQGGSRQAHKMRGGNFEDVWVFKK